MSWHIQDPERFEREKSEMLERHPDFSLLPCEPAPWDPRLRVVVWAGKVYFRDSAGGLLKSLGVKICCPPDYPQAIPLAYDDPRSLTPKECHWHMWRNDSLCYGRVDREEQLHPDNITVATVVDFLAHFVSCLWCYERGMGWPHEYLHRGEDFLDREINGEKIDKQTECLCGEKRKYGDCHYKVVDAFLKRANIPRKLIKISPNKLCPCGSRRKYKQCCSRKHARENFAHRPLFMILKYPELNHELAHKVWNAYVNRREPFSEVVRKSPLADYVKKGRHLLLPDGRR